MTEREIVTGLITVIDKENLRSLFAFTIRHALALGIALPESWASTVERIKSQMEKESNEQVDGS